MTPVVRVVPDVPSFSVDDGFAYGLPDGLEASVGSIVRVPLGGRRVRGWVVSTGEPERPRLKDVIAVSGDLPVFDRGLLEVLRWAASRYVAPLASLLAKATPPNLPRRLDDDEVPVTGRPFDASGPRTIVGMGPWSPAVIPAVADATGAGRTSVVIASTVEEADELERAIREEVGGRVVFASSHLPAAEVTRAWVSAATRPGTVLVGTREVALWPWADPGVVILVGEGRRGMKDKATPTVHARDVVLRRGAIGGFEVVMCGVVPSAEAVTRSVSVTSAARRAWGLVEVVDRRNDPPGGGLLAPTTQSALRAALADGRRVLLFTDRRVAAQRCIRCSTLRRCPKCGAGPGAEECPRCGAAVGACSQCGGRRFEALGSAAPRVIAEAGRIVGHDAVGEPGSGRPIVVGTERDLPGLSVDMTIVVDADGPLLAPNYRAGEDALRLLGRAVVAAGPGRGRRAIVQASDPEHPVIRALVSGDPIEFIRKDAARRAAAGFPPGGEIVVVEASGLARDAGAELAREMGGRADVHGPAPAGDGLRWLIQGRDLGPARTVLRGVVGRWREGGARVRVDADPIEL